MATWYTEFAQAQRDRLTTRSASPSYRDVQNDMKIARFSYTFTASELATEVIKLGKLGIEGAKVLVAHSRVWHAAAAPDIDLGVTLRKVNAAGTAVALSGVLEIDSEGTPPDYAFVKATADEVTLAATDELELLLGTITAKVAAGIIYVDVAYVAPSCP